MRDYIRQNCLALALFLLVVVQMIDMWWPIRTWPDGVRLGCAISALVFVLVVVVLSCIPRRDR